MDLKLPVTEKLYVIINKLILYNNKYKGMKQLDDVQFRYSFFL